MSIDIADILAASRRLAGHVRRTPVISLEAGAFGLPAQLVLKLECLQHAGSFKARGAFNALLTAQATGDGIPAAGVIAASGGNHGAAVAFAAKSLGYKAEIFVPQVASSAKIQRLRDLGAEIHIVGASYAEALIAAQARQRETDALSVHAYDEAPVLAGQGTLAQELQDQVPDLDSVLVAVGGGGLIGGVAAWYRSNVPDQGAVTSDRPTSTKVIGVEPEACPSLYQALAAGHPVDVEVSGVAADSLGARRVGKLGFELARSAVAQSLLVNDDAIRQARSWLWRDLRLAVEPGAATALAALISGRYPSRPGERIGVVICGGNTDLAGLA
jgi:threonine dehydratase